MSPAQVIAVILAAQQDDPLCVACGAQGFRLTNGRCDGCNSPDACPQCLTGLRQRTGPAEPDTGWQPAKCSAGCGWEQ